MRGQKPFTLVLRYVVVAGVLAAGLGELAKLQGWRLRSLLRKPH